MRILALLFCLLAWTTTGTAQGSLQTGVSSLKPLAQEFDDVVGLVTLPDEPAKIFVVERGGIVRVLENGKLAKHNLLDIEGILSPSENPGLSSIAFPSDYPKNKAFYVSYTDKQGDTIIGRFPIKRSETSDEDDLMVILKIVQPSPHSHRSFITFGTDGYLYIALGDAPPKRGAPALAQDPQSLFGKVLRIDVSDPKRYKIPSDNPYTRDKGGAPEVWASGFQQPEHLSFDQQTKRLFLIDSGRNTQEIDLVERGKNYGWNITEGEECIAPKCDSSALTRPLFSYNGSAVGGFIYTGDTHKSLQGAYIFADTQTKTIYKLASSGATWSRSSVAQAQSPIVALGQSSAGEILVATEEGSLSTLIP
jgi:glucose/arabinose dehydrogenase